MEPASFLGASPTKSNIIEILSKKWPLGAKKIYGELTRNYHLLITYQAVHKALKELTENKTLEKKREGYLINREWVTKLGDFSEKLTAELEDFEQKREVKMIQKIKFNNHREFIKFHREFMEEIVKKEKKLKMVFYYRHVPSPNVMSNEELERMRKIMPKISWTILSKKDTAVGRWLAKQWKRMGVEVKLGVDISADRMMILNDYIMNVYTSKEAIKLWDKNYSVKNVKDFDTTIVTKAILNPDYKTIMTILKDKEISSLLRSLNS